METPKASGVLRRAPDPTPRYARFAHATPLRYVGKTGRTRAGAPPWPNPGSATDNINKHLLMLNAQKGNWTAKANHYPNCHISSQLAESKQSSYELIA